MVDKNRLYITYEVSGLKPCGDSASTADDIKLNVVELIPQKSHDQVGYVEITRIPSDLRQINAARVADGYGMINIMMSERDSKADIIGQEMDLGDPDMSQPFTQVLKENDLYVIKYIQVTKRRRGQGYCTAILESLPAVLTRIANDRQPVIAVVPFGTEEEKVRHIFEKNGYKKVHACAQTLYFYSE